MEDSIMYDLTLFKEFIQEKNWEIFQKKFTVLLEEVQRDGFMEGYRYAITILEENLIKK